MAGSSWGACVSGAVDWAGPRRQTCPSCGRNDRDKTLGVTINDDGSGVAHCFRCEYVETWRDDRGRITNAPTPQRVVRSVPEQPASLSDHWLAFFNRLPPVAGIALSYLQARGCHLPPGDGDLRCCQNLKHKPTGHTGPALVALVTDAKTCEPMTLHFTWVNADGTKANVDPPRLLLGGHRKAGGVIRLWPDEAVTTGLAVAEGIETALALAHVYRPAWACIDAGNLAALPVLAGIECLVIGADHDEAGLRAAEACADRWTAAGVDVVAMAPTQRRTDWCDWRAAA